MKILYPIIAVLLSGITFIPLQEVKVISSYCYLYVEPSFTSEKVFDGSEPLVILHGEELTVLEDDGQSDFILVSYSDNYDGYVYRYYISSNTSQTVYPVFNGSIRRESMLYDIDRKPANIILKQGQQVYIYSGYDDDEGCTAVTVVLEDGELYNGYVLTKDIAPNGISPLLIAGITIIVACVTVILSLILIKKVKKKK